MNWGGAGRGGGLLLRTDSLVLNFKMLPQSVACMNPIWSEPTRDPQRSLHVRTAHMGRGANGEIWFCKGTPRRFL